jgi:hypothetical protein
VDQFLGKSKVSVDVHDHNPLMDLMGAVLINPGGMPSHRIIIDGDIVTDEDRPTHVPHADPTQSGMDDAD